MNNGKTVVYASYIIWSLFGIILGLLIGLGTGQLLIAVLIGAIFGSGLAILISRHTKRTNPV